MDEVSLLRFLFLQVFLIARLLYERRTQEIFLDHSVSETEKNAQPKLVRDEGYEIQWLHYGYSAQIENYNASVDYTGERALL